MPWTEYERSESVLMMWSSIRVGGIKHRPYQTPWGYMSDTHRDERLTRPFVALRTHAVARRRRAPAPRLSEPRRWAVSACAAAQRAAAVGVRVAAWPVTGGSERGKDRVGVEDLGEVPVQVGRGHLREQVTREDRAVGRGLAEGVGGVERILDAVAQIASDARRRLAATVRLDPADDEI